MSIGIERLRDELTSTGGADTNGDGAFKSTPDFERQRRDAAAEAHAFRDQLGLWEDLLSLVVDPDHPRVADRERKRRLLSFLLERAGIDEARFWMTGRGKRGRLFLSRYSRVSREIPQLEISSFDLDKLLKERYRHEPLTLGAAWHYGFWRSYFSHAAITHPANDGLREEFSTAWDIVRKHPAVLFRTAGGVEQSTLTSIHLDMPMLVGPLPWSDGETMERAYLQAIEAADPGEDLHTRTLLIVEAERYLDHIAALSEFGEHLMLRIPADMVQWLDGEGERFDTLREALRRSRIVELEWSGDLAGDVERVLGINPRLLISVYLPIGGDPAAFWHAIETAARQDGVAAIHYHSGPEKSYRLTPRVDAFLKARFLRARVQLISAGGNTDTQSSAATVYESVLLGANGGSMTHLAGLALCPELIDAYHGADPKAALRTLATRPPDELRDQAVNTLTCWQHSILDFLSCMGIDDIQKTSGNTMAITMTEEWVREVDRLATREFGALNADLNAKRIAAEPVPAGVRERFKVTSLLRELTPELPLVHAARILAHRNANYHLENSNRNLGADHLEVIYKMAAGQLPRTDDFFIESDMGPLSLDGIGLKLSRRSLERSLARLRRDPSSLDYISLAVPRGFLRPGAVPAGSEVTLQIEGEPGSSIAFVTFASFTADGEGGFDQSLDSTPELESTLASGASLWISALDAEGDETRVELLARGHGGHGLSLVRASRDGTVTLRRSLRAGAPAGYQLSGFGFREPVWHGPVNHSSISLGAASEDFLTARVEGNSGLSMTSSGEGGPIRLSADQDWKWESMQAASGHFGIQAVDLRRVRDVEIKINQGAKPGKGGRLSGAKVTPTVSRARNIPVGTDALSPDPKHDIYSIEDMPAEVWLWLLYHNYCGIKITGSNYTRYVAAGMWSNFVVDYLLVDSGLGGSGNYHADSSHVGWPDIFRTILHTHHALVGEKVDLEKTGTLQSIRDLNGAPFGAKGGTRLFASGGLRGEVDMLKVLIAGADALMEASIGKAVAFGCNQCGNCHLDCPRGGITTKAELTMQNDRGLMRQRFRNWTVLNMVKLAVLIDALNLERGAIDDDGEVSDAEALFSDIRQLRGRTDLLEMPEHGEATRRPAQADEHDSCRVGSLAVTEPVNVHAIWESARLSFNGGNNRGGGIDFAGFAPAPLREKTCVIINTIGPDRVDTMREMLGHFEGCRFFDVRGREVKRAEVIEKLDAFRVPVRAKYAHEGGWRDADLRENPGDFYLFFVELEREVLHRYGATLLASEHWLQRRTKYGDLSAEALSAALASAGEAGGARGAPQARGGWEARDRLDAFVADVREEYFSALAHLLDSRYYRTHRPDDAPAGKFAAKRRGFVVSIGEDLGAIKMSGWTHTIPEYFDFDQFWSSYPGVRDAGGVEYTFKGRPLKTLELRACAWGMHHRYPTNSPAIDAEGRGNPAGAHPFKAYNVLLMHNGEQVGVDSTSPFLNEFGYVHADPSMGESHALYAGDSIYERKALTDTEYAAYLVDFTRRVLGLTTEEASQIISPITGLDLKAMDEARRRKLELLMTNYVQLTPTGPYKFTIVESRRVSGGPAGGADGASRTRRVVGFRENMDIKFLRPHEIIVSRDTGRRAAGGASGTAGVTAVANGSEAKIADSMLRVLHQQGVLGDAAADLRFSMRPGGNPARRDFGGVFEAFTAPGSGAMDLRNRFGEEVPVDRAGGKLDLSEYLAEAVKRANPDWVSVVNEHLQQLGRLLEGAGGMSAGRLFGPEDLLPAPGAALVERTLERAATLEFADLRMLAEQALPEFAKRGDAARAAAIRILTELRKRVAFASLGAKALSSVEYLLDGGRDAGGQPEGALYRLFDQIPALFEVLQQPVRGTRYMRVTLRTRDDLAPPADPARDVLVIDFAGFKGESFRLDSASRFVSRAVELGWRNLIGYGFIGGPRYVGTNLGDARGVAARGVTIELYGREFGDFIGALLEGASIWVYGQGQSHLGMKADSGELFVLQDILNTGAYAAHGASFSVWDSGSRFAAAGQNKVFLADGRTPAQGFKSIHWGSPNEYAFEYLMSGGDNSLHVVMGLRKPDARGELALRAKPYGGKFFMSGAAAGRVFVFDPLVKLDPAQYSGNVVSQITLDEWSRELTPLLSREARRRGLPIRLEGEHFTLRLEGEWKRWRYDEAFVKLIPLKVAKAAQQQGVVAPQLAQIVAE
ncbi:MAG TPA: glutamate synthase-related protein [Candidatus Sulfotelmatobacter sp.]|nr:glutamate synthase-related protein [Candidatus Sulfotelmatobacter sp.]